MKICKNITSIFIVMCLVFNLYSVAFAQNDLLVSSYSLNGNKLTVMGYGENIKLLVLNPGKTVSQLDEADYLEAFKEVVNYTNTFNVGSADKYTKTITIKDFDSKSKYLLYVKDKNGEFCAEIGYTPVEVYVSANAAEGGDGSIEKPFSTIEAARNYVRTLNKTSPVNVILRGGKYNMSSEIQLTAEDSGTENAPVTYRAKDGERVILNGSEKLNINKISKVTDGDILGKVNSDVADKLVEIDLNEQGIPQKIVNYLSNHVKGWYGKPIGVYLNGEGQNVARWPNSGYATITGVKTTDGIADFSFKEIDADRVKKWIDAENMYIEGYLANNWAGEWAKVGGVDSVTKKITLAEKTTYGVANGYRAAVVNLLEEIDVPGEWYANPQTMKMYYYPPHTLTQGDSLEIATLDRNFISIEGAEFINIEGIEFTKNANSPSYFDESPRLGNGILVNNSSNIEISNCKFKDIGMSGVFVQGSSKVKIDSCLINNTGFSGITIKNCGVRETLTSAQITVSNSYISSASRDSARGDKNGIFIGNNCVGITVENNVLSNMKNAAIRYYGNSHIIRNNEIYNCVTETSDAGAIYAGRSFSQYGTVISNNYFHHIGQGLDDNGASALFLDDLHSGDTFVGNIVDMNNMEFSAGVGIAGGRDVVVKDNIIVNSLYSVRGRDRNVTFSDKEYSEEDSDDFYNSELFQSFKGATSESVTNAYYITDADWFIPFKVNFPVIMENFNDLMVKKNYRAKNTITDNISYNSTIAIGEKMTADSTVERNYTPADKSAFVDAEMGDYRLTKAYKQSGDISNGVPDEDFSLKSIGVQNELVITDEEKSFELIYPLNSDTVSCEKINLKWNKSDFADRYVYEIATDSKFRNIVATGEVLDNSAVIESLDNNATYYWRVTAVNKSKQYAYQVVADSVFSFKTADSIRIDNVKYERKNNQIAYRITNNTEQLKNIKVLSALKAEDGRLLGVKIQDVSLKANTAQSLKISTVFETEGTILEFYVWDFETGLKCLTAKHVFDK